MTQGSAMPAIYAPNGASPRRMMSYPAVWSLVMTSNCSPASKTYLSTPLQSHHPGLSSAPPIESKAEVRILHDLHCLVGEAPTWDERTQRLYFVDIVQKKIYSSSADGSDLFSIDVGKFVSTIALTTDENLILATTARSVHPVDVSRRTVGEAIATLPDDDETEKLHFNDGKASPGGVFLVGVKHRDWLSEGTPGRTYRLHWTSRSKGHFEELVAVDKIGLPNGMDWDDDHFYLADTYNHTITAFKTGSDGVPLRESGSKAIQGKVLFKADNEDGPQGPDGMCLSKQGNLWVALLGNGKVKAYSKATGKSVHEVILPVKMPSAATFGGPNLDTLFVTSIGIKDESEHNGAVFAVTMPGETGLNAAYKVKVPAH